MHEESAPPIILVSVPLVLSAQRQMVTLSTLVLVFVVVQHAQQQRASFAPRISVSAQPRKSVLTKTDPLPTALIALVVMQIAQRRRVSTVTVMPVTAGPPLYQRV